MYIDKNITLNEDLKKVQIDYLKNNQNVIKDEIEKVYDYIIHKKLNSEKELREDIKNRVIEAHNLMIYIYEKYKDKESPEEIKTRIKDSLRALRFNDNRGYFYINDLNGTSVLNSLNPEIENKRILDLEDQLKNVVLIDETATDENKVKIWALVTITEISRDETNTYKIVWSTEADILAELPKISNESPIGRALIWKKKWDKVKIKVQAWSYEYKIIEIK